MSTRAVNARRVIGSSAAKSAASTRAVVVHGRFAADSVQTVRLSIAISASACGGGALHGKRLGSRRSSGPRRIALKHEHLHRLRHSLADRSEPTILHYSNRSSEVRRVGRAFSVVQWLESFGLSHALAVTIVALDCGRDPRHFCRRFGTVLHLVGTQSLGPNSRPSRSDARRRQIRLAANAGGRRQARLQRRHDSRPMRIISCFASLRTSHFAAHLSPLWHCRSETRSSPPISTSPPSLSSPSCRAKCLASSWPATVRARSGRSSAAFAKQPRSSATKCRAPCACSCRSCLAGTLNLNTIANNQAGFLWNWYLFHDPFTFAAFWIFFTCATASCKRAPFDLAEAESELVAGFHTEYSRLALVAVLHGRIRQHVCGQRHRHDPLFGRLEHRTLARRPRRIAGPGQHLALGDRKLHQRRRIYRQGLASGFRHDVGALDAAAAAHRSSHDDVLEVSACRSVACCWSACACGNSLFRPSIESVVRYVLTGVCLRHDHDDVPRADADADDGNPAEHVAFLRTGRGAPLSSRLIMTAAAFLFWVIAGVTGVSAVMVLVTQNIVRAAAWFLFTLAGVSGTLLSARRGLCRRHATHCLCRRDAGARRVRRHADGARALRVDEIRRRRMGRDRFWLASFCSALSPEPPSITRGRLNRSKTLDAATSSSTTTQLGHAFPGNP